MAHKTMQQCIDTCWQCRHECQATLFNHCLPVGGKHAETSHVNIMIDCIQICQAAADAMVRQSPLHSDICKACADICDACAVSCEALDGEEMKTCAELCRQCAEHCRDMGEMKHMTHMSEGGDANHIMA